MDASTMTHRVTNHAKRLFREWAPELVVLILTTLLFTIMIAFGVSNDIHLHAKYVQKVAQGVAPFPANFLYYLSVFLAALGRSDSLPWLYHASACVLGLATAEKFAITRRLLHESLSDEQHPSPEKISLFLSACLLTSFSIPMRFFIEGGNFYLGQIPPTVWHNSTTIFMMPFALLLFLSSLRQIEQPSDRQNLAPMLVFILLNAFAKPSFLFVFVVAYPLFMFGIALRRNDLSLFFPNMIPVVTGILLIFAIYILIYKFSLSTLSDSDVGKSGVAVLPLAVWRRFSPHIPLSLSLSLLFPVVYVILYPRELCKPALAYSWCLFAVAVIISILFVETGPRQWHGNFFWQNFVCMFILFLTSCDGFGRHILTQGIRHWKIILLSLCLGAHVLSGFVYITSLFIRGTYR